MRAFSFAAIAPALFVFLWSTGFIGARYGLPHAEPHTFLAIRFVIVIALLAVVALWRRAAWPRSPVLSKSFAVGDLPLVAVAYALLGLIGITFGTLYQKRHVVNVDLWSGSLVQFCAALLPTGLLALCFEHEAVQWTPSFVFALAWLCLVLSLGAISVLWTLIQRGAAARVASLFDLVPPATAFEAWLLFDETLRVVQMAGIALTAVGVALINRASAAR